MLTLINKTDAISTVEPMLIYQNCFRELGMLLHLLFLVAIVMDSALTEEPHYDDYDLEEDFEETAEEELRTLSGWLLEHPKDEDGIWSPLGFCPPPSSVHVNRALCDAQRCTSDDECISQQTDAENSTSSAERACCYNGCVHTCTTKLDPPIAIDWIEEPQGTMDHLKGSTDSEQQYVRAGPEAIALPGGCIINTHQFKQLEDFKKHSHVGKCFCDKGGVSCEVDHEKRFER